MIAIVQNNEIVNTGTLRSLFPNTSFPATGPNDEWKTDNGVVDIVNTRSFDTATQHLETADAYLEDGVAYTVHVVTNSDEYNTQRAADEWTEVRSLRDMYLQESDWTQLSDVSNVDKTAWATYRQQLRDITTQADPFNITWPSTP
jgi:hypothetical protein